MMRPHRATIPIALLLLFTLAGCRHAAHPGQGAPVVTLTLTSSEPIWGLEAVIAADGAALELVAVASTHPSALVVAHPTQAGDAIRLGLISAEGVHGEVALVHLRTRTPDTLSLRSFEALGVAAEPLPHAQLEVAYSEQASTWHTVSYNVEAIAAQLQRTLQRRGIAP
jgi:hypothetical protein